MRNEVRYQVRLSSRAEYDVGQVLRWFQKQQAQTAGGRWYGQLLARIETLETRPERCRLADEAEEIGIELREILFGRRSGLYRILFEIRGRIVHILRIRHAARDSLSAEDL